MKVELVGRDVIRLTAESRKDKELLMMMFNRKIQFKTPFLDRSRRINKLDLILKGVK